MKLGNFYYLFSVSHEKQQRNHYKIISWIDLSLPTDHNTSDCLEEKQHQEPPLLQHLSLLKKEEPKVKIGTKVSKLWIFMIILGQTNKRPIVTEI